MKRVHVLSLLLLIASCSDGEDAAQSRLHGPASGRDTAPWSNSQFRGDREAWRSETAERARLQSEIAGR
jgi:hypothetical protein